MLRLWLIPSLLLLGCEALWGGFNKPHFELAQASRSSTIAITDDDAFLVMVNPDHGSISIFELAQLGRTAIVPTGPEPSAVVLHPDGDTAFVANRGNATVVKISGIRSPSPQMVAMANVGSEPTGLALSPRGRTLFVAEFAESSISVLRTDDLSTEKIIEGVQNPRTLAVTNNFDGQDEDEFLVVSHYFGEPLPNSEGKNASRQGKIDLFPLRGLAIDVSIPLPVVPTEITGGDVASPNQLGGMVIAPDGRLYVTDQAVSPAPPLTADRNVNPLVHVVDLASRAEVTQGAGTVSLARLLTPMATPSTLFLADPVDIDFVHDKKSFGFVGYVVSRGADAVERMVFDPDKGTVAVGSMQNLQIDVAGNDTLGRCQAPIGGVVAVKSQRMFLNCWLSRTLAVLDLTSQTLQSTFKAVDNERLSAPVLRGAQAFHSARGRMAQAGRIACASCHPDGRSDGVTWVFPNGPRQTPALDNVFSHGGGQQQQQQRILSWTGNADEIADFEELLRTVMGGRGGITTANPPSDCGDLAKEMPVALNPALGSPNKPPANSCATTWDDLESYIAQLRPTRRLTRLDPDSVARGAALFGTGGQSGGCIKCHSEAGWTLAHRFYTPSTTLPMNLATVAFNRPSAWPAFYTPHGGDFQVSPQPSAAESPAQTIQPLQVACAVRNVTTFGDSALEVDSANGRAQGRGGYNIPGLYSLAVTPPFLHHGQATSLDALFQNSSFIAHLTAGAANFDVLNDGIRSDLISFLLSLDQSAAELPAPGGFNAGCATQ